MESDGSCLYVHWRSAQSGSPTFPVQTLLCTCKRYRCRQIPAFCDDTEWPVLEWEMLFNQNGEPLNGEAQETSWFYTPEDREGVENPVNVT